MKPDCVLGLLKVEQFWRFYSHMIRPGDLTGHSDFHIFKEGIKPMWEVLRYNSLQDTAFCTRKSLFETLSIDF